ncbi:MAG TPA: GTPase, partial [Planctomycetota bacterium]|nr:GTPase [Planctomycetota bacterium]
MRTSSTDDEIFAGDEDRILAISSPLGASSQAVLRVSGPRAWRAIEAIVAGDGCVEPPERGFRMRSVRLRCGSVELDARVLFFRAPASYTREDMVEIFLPGSEPVVSACAREIIASGEARWAGPGEFTLRAFLNGRMDLAEAEAVEQVISAANDAELAAARRALSGELSSRVRSIADRAADALALVEAGLDFPDEDLPSLSSAKLASDVAEVRRALRELERSSALRIAPAGSYSVVLAGFPNAGKSSLLNAIVERPAALVSPHAGTTRDPVRASTIEGDLRIEWIDLAGGERVLSALELDREEPVGLEANLDDEGLRALRRITRVELEGADLVLWVVDPTDRPEDSFRAARSASHGVEIVVTKRDLLAKAEADGLAASEPGIAHWVSSVTGDGVRDLRRSIAARARGESRGDDGLAREKARYVVSAREASAFRAAADALERAERTLESGGGAAALELVAIDLREALRALEAFSGAVTTEDILDR